jgi:hypothetical protein
MDDGPGPIAGNGNHLSPIAHQLLSLLHRLPGAGLTHSAGLVVGYPAARRIVAG